MTGNKSDPFGNTKLVSVGFEGQSIKLRKEGLAITANLFGVTVGSFNKLEELIKFGMRMQTTMGTVGERLKSEMEDKSTKI
jgi:hypothetical protein